MQEYHEYCPYWYTAKYTGHEESGLSGDGNEKTQKTRTQGLDIIRFIFL